MPNGTISATAIISAEDRTGAAFDAIAKKMKGIGKGAKVSAEVDRLTKSLARAENGLRVIDQHRANKGGFYTAKNALVEAQRAADGAARALSGATKPTRALEAEAQRTARALDAATKAFERQKAAAFSSRRALSEGGVSADKLISEQARLRAAVDATSRALERQHKVDRQASLIADRRQLRRDNLKVAAGVVGLGAVHKAEHFGAESLRTYREFDKERRFGKVVMGLTDEEQKPLVDQAIHLGATTKYNDVKVLEAQRELAARGLKKDQVMGLLDPATKLGMSLDLGLPEAVKQMEGAIFGFKKDISTLEAAKASARQTADFQVKAAKVSGMTPEDISQTYKYGATPARMSGLSEEMLLGFAGISKKANMGGDEAGVAFRALVAAGQSPTRKAKEAMLANGMNFKNYQKNPDSLAVQPFAENVAAQYGVKLKGNALAKVSGIFADKGLINDPAKFTPAIVSALKQTLGGNDAKSLKSIAGAANRYRDASTKGIDMNALVADLMTKIPGNLQLANAVFGSKQGARIATALGDPETFKHLVDEIKNHSGGFSETVAKERMSGFDGAVSRLDGSIKNLETALGRSLDNDGKGGLLTGATDLAGRAIQAFAELNSGAHAAAVTLGVVGSAFVGVKSLGLLAGGFGLSGSAAALSTSAAALDAAAVKLGATGVAGAAGGAATAGGAVAGAGGAVAGGSVAAAAGVVGAVAAAGGALSVAAANVVARDPEAFLNDVGPEGYGIAAHVFAKNGKKRGLRVFDDYEDAAGNTGERGRKPGWKGSTLPSSDWSDDRGALGERGRTPGWIGRAPLTSDWSDARGGLGERGRVGSAAPTREYQPASPIVGNSVEQAIAGFEARLSGKPLEATVKPDQVLAKLDGRVPVDVTGKLDPVKLEGQGVVLIRVEGPGTVANTSSSGHIALRSAGTSMGSRVSTGPGGIGGV